MTPPNRMLKIRGSSKQQERGKETDASAKQTAEAKAFMASSSQPSKSWFSNTCGSAHMTSVKEMMTGIREHGGFVQVANSQRMTVTEIGKVRLQ